MRIENSESKLTTENYLKDISQTLESRNLKMFTVDKSCEYATQIPKEELLNKFIATCNKMMDVRKKKGHDYGSVFEDTYADYGLLAPIARFRDKLGRIETLIKVKNNQVSDESLKDTILDLANYCVMTYSLMDCIDDYIKHLTVESDENVLNTARIRTEGRVKPLLEKKPSLTSTEKGVSPIDGGSYGEDTIDRN